MLTAEDVLVGDVLFGGAAVGAVQLHGFVPRSQGLTILRKIPSFLASSFGQGGAAPLLVVPGEYWLNAVWLRGLPGGSSVEGLRSGPRLSTRVDITALAGLLE
jgi:hypothetical protein